VPDFLQNFYKTSTKLNRQKKLNRSSPVVMYYNISYNMSNCSICNKTFKNLNLHITKIHTIYDLKIVDRERIELYKNKILIDTLIRTPVEDWYGSDKDGPCILFRIKDGDEYPEYKKGLYWGHKEDGYMSVGVGGQRPTSILSTKFLQN